MKKLEILKQINKIFKNITYYLKYFFKLPLVKYILKRLGILLITLFLISIITFVVTRAAPGDPISLKSQAASTSPNAQPITEEMIEENKKLYGFDKNLLFNFKEKGTSYNTKILIFNFLKSTSFEEKHLIDIKLLNTLMLNNIFNLHKLEIPDNFFKIKKYNPTKMESINRFLAYQKKISILHHFCYEWLNVKKKDFKSFIDLNKYYKSIQIKFSKNYLLDKLKKFTKQGQRNLKSEILNAKAYAVPVLVNYVLDDSNLKYAKEVIDLLATLTGKPWKYSKKEEKEYLYYIEKFWEYEKHKYIEFSFFEKLGRVFTDTQYGNWVSKILDFDFDVSYSHKKPVLELIKERLPITLQLNIISILLIYLFSVYIGIYSATIHNSFKERMITLGLFILFSLPSFWIANLCIMFFTGSDAFILNFLPTQGIQGLNAEQYGSARYFLDYIWHLILPIIILTYSGLAYLSRQMKVSMLEALQQDYVRTAWAKGLPKKMVIYKHALRNALIPIVTLLGGLLPAMLGGSIIIEEIFSINGMGKLSFEAIMSRDYPVINAIFFFSTFLTLIGYLISDLLYKLVDPRIKLEKVDM